MIHTKSACINMQVMKVQAGGTQALRVPWKYLTAQTSKHEEMDKHNLKRYQQSGFTAIWVTHCPACTPARECMGRYTRNQSRDIQQAQEDCCPGCKGEVTPTLQTRCTMTEMKLACSTTQAVQQAASWRALITADTPMSQVAYKRALLRHPLKVTQQGSS